MLAEGSGSFSSTCCISRPRSSLSARDGGGPAGEGLNALSQMAHCWWHGERGLASVACSGFNHTRGWGPARGEPGLAVPQSLSQVSWSSRECMGAKCNLSSLSVILLPQCNEDVV